MPPCEHLGLLHEGSSWDCPVPGSAGRPAVGDPTKGWERPGVMAHAVIPVTQDTEEGREFKANLGNSERPDSKSSVLSQQA